jgi:pyruvate, water dikinase
VCSSDLLFKNAGFPPELVQGLSMALDDLGPDPLIVRSSSLLEDRLGTAFSGKYKSLFLANQGSKARRLEALMDAVAEIYTCTNTLSLHDALPICWSVTV